MRLLLFSFIIFISSNLFSQSSGIVLFTKGTPIEITSDNTLRKLNEGDQIHNAAQIQLETNDEIIIITSRRCIHINQSGTHKISDLIYKIDLPTEYYRYLYSTKDALSERETLENCNNVDSLKNWALQKRYPTKDCVTSTPKMCIGRNELKDLKLGALNLQLQFSPLTKNKQFNILSFYGEVKSQINFKSRQQSHLLDIEEIKPLDQESLFVLQLNEESQYGNAVSKQEPIFIDTTQAYLYPKKKEELLILAYHFDLDSKFAQAHHCFEKAYLDFSTNSTKQHYTDFLHRLGGHSEHSRYKIKHSVIRKPVIYLYPEKTDTFSVKINYDGHLTYTYPKYKGEWNVIAEPNGQLINLSDQSSHSYLFYEGEKNLHSNKYFQSGKGYCIKGSETISFLQKNLKNAGLTPKEYNDFIVYWLPFMQGNAYNQIYFLIDKEYDNEVSTLSLNKTPNKERKLFMLFQKLDLPVDLKPQSFPFFERKGFTLIEWGGSEIE